MPHRFSKILAVASLVNIAACQSSPPLQREVLAAPTQETTPTQEEIAKAVTMPKPSSQEIAEQAVREYFETKLKDPTSAMYKFRPLQSGALVYNGKHESGWFMCGDINAKNSYGGYTGYDLFLVHFSPQNGDKVAFGSMADTVGRQIHEIRHNPTLSLEEQLVEVEKLEANSEYNKCKELYGY